jgi:hypothetical protein
MSSEMNEVRDHLDIKDRKISVLQRKVNICEGQEVNLYDERNVCVKDRKISFLPRKVRGREENK